MSAAITSTLAWIGEAWLILADAIRRLFARPFEFLEMVNQMSFVGVSSVPIVVMTGFFSGAVLSLYLSEFLLRYGASQFVGATVALSAMREIGPVLAGIMVAARCGSAMAAQLGTMAVTEQVDALKMLSVHPTKYLVVPRVLACVLMMPILALVGMWSAVVGGWIVAVGQKIPSTTFIQSVQQFGTLTDVGKGMLKAPVFGLIIAIVACREGLYTTGGAEGVGRATTRSVVISTVLVYVANFVLAQLLFQ